jgi:hypothetical protein
LVICFISLSKLVMSLSVGWVCRYYSALPLYCKRQNVTQRHALAGWAAIAFASSMIA